MTGFITTLRELMLVAGLCALALGLLYLLRPRRRRIEVPFGALWQRVLVEAEARSLGRHWQRLMSLLLMLAIAALLVAALAEPLWGGKRGDADLGRHHTVLILDTSASMATRDGRWLGAPDTRLHEAMAALGDLVEKAPRDEQFLLLAASGHVRVLAGWGTPRPVLRAALERARPTAGGLDLQRALAAAREALAGRTARRVVLATDGGPALTAGPLGTLEVLRAGPGRAQAQRAARAAPPNAAAILPDGLQNLAIVAVHVRPAAGDPGRGVMTVRVRNDSRGTVSARLAIAASDVAQDAQQFGKDAALGRIAAVTLPPGTSSHAVPDVELAAARFAVHVQAEPPPPGQPPGFVDVAAQDDWGFAVLAERRELHLLLVTDGNLFLEAGLLASERVRLHTIRRAEWRKDAYAFADRGRHGIDVVVLDQVPGPLPDGMPGLVLRVDADGTEPARHAQAPELAVRAGDHPAMRGVSFQDANFDRVRVLRPAPGDRILAVALPGAPVMVARQVPVRTLEWGLDLLETDLGGRFALPILLDDAVAWLAGEEEPLLAPLELGRPWAIEAPGAGPGWRHIEPGRLAVPARASGGQLLAASETHGIHVWIAPTGHAVARATVLPASEAPADLRVAGRPVAARRAGRADDDAPERPTWAVLLAIAALVLAGEWGLYLRRRTV